MTVVMPEGAVASKVAACLEYGADVVLHGTHVGESLVRLDEIRKERGLVLVHPYDDPEVLLGNGSCGLEILEDLPDVDVIVIAVGGGGLLGGVTVAVRESRPRIRVYAVEPTGSDALRQALAAGAPVQIIPSSVADGLNAPSAGRLALDVARRYVEGVIVIDDETILTGLRFSIERLKQVVEPAGAAALAAVITGAVPHPQRRARCRDPLRRERRHGPAGRPASRCRAPGRPALMNAPGAPSDEAPDRRPQTGSAPAADQRSGPPPPPGPDAYRARFDGAFVGPMLPPSAPHPLMVAAPAPTPVSEAVLAIPLGTRALIRQALDLLTRRDAGLRGASFYIGFMLLATVTPMVVILGLALTLAEPADLGGYDSSGQPSAWPAWLLLAAIPASLGYLAAATEARSLATAVIGGRVEGRPLRLRESIAVARRRFWAMLAAQLLAGVIAMVASVLAQVLVFVAFGNGEELNFALSLAVSIVVATPFVYVPAGIVLGEVTVRRPSRARSGWSAPQAPGARGHAVRGVQPVHRAVRAVHGHRHRRAGPDRIRARGGRSAARRRSGRRGARVRPGDAGLPRGGHRGRAGRPRVRGADALHPRAGGGTPRARPRATPVGPAG